MSSINYILSGTFASGVVTSISSSGMTRSLLDYGAEKPSQQCLGSAFVLSSNKNGVEEGIEVMFKFDENDSGQLDVYAYPFTRFNGKTWREDNYLRGEVHHPTGILSGSVTIFNANVSGITSGTISVMRCNST